MKTLQFFAGVILFLTLSFSGKAQSEQYVPAMKENIEKINHWSESPKMLAATFERIAQAESNQWLPYYYAAYANIINSFTLSASDAKDQVLDHAQDILNKAFGLHPDSSECMVLQGFLYIAKLQVDPTTRGAEYSQKANEAFDEAIRLNAANPRAYYMKGSTVLHTPEFFGGGKKPAKPILETALAKYEAFVPSGDLSPNWGKDDCKRDLDSCL